MSPPNRIPTRVDLVPGATFGERRGVYERMIESVRRGNAALFTLPDFELLMGHGRTEHLKARVSMYVSVLSHLEQQAAAGNDQLAVEVRFKWMLEEGMDIVRLTQEEYDYDRRLNALQLAWEPPDQE